MRMATAAIPEGVTMVDGWKCEWGEGECQSGRLGSLGRVGYFVLMHDRLQGDEEKDQARGDLQHLRGNGTVVEHLLAEGARDSDGGSREEGGAGREAEAEDAIALLGRGGEGTEELNWTKHQE
jgi:hypothetical protein